MRWTILLLILLLPSQARADRYYLLVFGSQSVPKIPRYTHTWAVFVRAYWPNPECREPTLNVVTISWMPATLVIRPFALHPEPGVNLDMVSTLRFEMAQGQRISVWGPYEIRQRLYDKALAQQATLASGQYLYKTVDPLIFGSRSAADCIHALTDLDQRHARLFYQELTRYGEKASYFAVHQFHVEGRIINPGIRHDWVYDRLGLNCYPLVRRQYYGTRFYFPGRDYR